MKFILTSILIILFFVLVAGIQTEEEVFSLPTDVISEERLDDLNINQIKETLHNMPDEFDLVGIVDENVVYLELDGLYYLYRDELIYIGDEMPPGYIP